MATDRAVSKKQSSLGDFLGLWCEFAIDFLVIRYLFHLSWALSLVIPYMGTSVTFNLRKIRKAVEK